MSKFTILPRIRGPWLPTIHLQTIVSWLQLSAVIFTQAVATLLLTKPGATIRAPTRGTMLRSPICLRAARVPPPEPTKEGGYLQEATSTSPLARVRLPGIRLSTLGVTLQIWYRPAITSQAQLQANRSTPLPGTLPPALLPMTTSSTPKPDAAHRPRHLLRRQHQRLRQLRL